MLCSPFTQYLNHLGIIGADIPPLNLCYTLPRRINTLIPPVEQHKQQKMWGGEQQTHLENGCNIIDTKSSKVFKTTVSIWTNTFKKKRRMQKSSTMRVAIAKCLFHHLHNKLQNTSKQGIVQLNQRGKQILKLRFPPSKGKNETIASFQKQHQGILQIKECPLKHIFSTIFLQNTFFKIKVLQKPVKTPKIMNVTSKVNASMKKPSKFRTSRKNFHRK